MIVRASGPAQAAAAPPPAAETPDNVVAAPRPGPKPAQAPPPLVEALLGEAERLWGFEPDTEITLEVQQAAARILPQIAAGEFWVSTHPEMTRAYAAARAGYLAGLETPSLSAELAASLKSP